jgi:lipopolysaccharide transport system permease protein
MDPSSAASDASPGPRPATLAGGEETETASRIHASLARSRPVRIHPRSGWQPIDLGELWRYRELLWILALRDVKVRYKQTVLGAAWAIIQPVLTMIVFSIFFGNLAGLSSRIEGGIPYPLYTFCALLPWQLFSSSLTSAGSSLVGNQSLISKVYFPRLVIPLASIFGSLVDFLVAFVVLVGLIFAYGAMGYAVAPSWAILTLPLFVALAFLTALAVGLWLSALNVEYRDVRYVIPFIVQFWMFITPIAYPSSLVRDRSVALYRLYGLNPMVGVVDGFRWAILGNAPAPGGALVVSIAAMVVLLIGGLYYFRRMERTFADLV